MILQKEISYFRDSRAGEDILVGEEINGFVEKVREDGRVNVSLRPIGLDKIQNVQKLVSTEHIILFFTSFVITKIKKIKSLKKTKITATCYSILNFKMHILKIMDALEGSPTRKIPIGDKSSPEDIGSYIYGISKSDFKNAVGGLYKKGLIKPSDYETELVDENERKIVDPEENSDTIDPKVKKKYVIFYQP